MYHDPVLADVSTHYLLTDNSGTYVDATLGGGGHTSRILERLSERGKVIGIDQDLEAIAVCKDRFRSEDRVEIIHDNFSQTATVLEGLGVEQVHGILIDLGISSHQVDTAERGFSFKLDGPLDMRMNADQGMTAADFLHTADEGSIANVIWKYGEERQSRKIAKAIVNARQTKPLTTTGDLSDVIEQAIPPVQTHKTLARVFQAIRIYINDELSALERILETMYPLVMSGGRMVIISYHSLEDRIVKQFFRDIVTDDPQNPYSATRIEQRFTLLTRKPVTPDEEEIYRNPRARSARLRAAEKK